MKDMIYRQDAIDAIRTQAIHTPEALNDIGIAYYEGLHYAFQVISMLPSAQSESKNGKWIRESLVTDCPYKCSACKKYSRAMYDYCPNCGACMRG